MTPEHTNFKDLADQEFQKITDWHARETQERKPGDRGEYLLSLQKPEVLKHLLGVLLSTPGGYVPFARMNLSRHGEVQDEPSERMLEKFKTLLKNTTYEVEYSRDWITALLSPEEMLIVYTAPEE